METADKQERALRNATASSEMERLHVTPEMDEAIRQMLAGKLTLDDYVATILASNAEE